MAISVIISWSSGKDAMLTLERLHEDPRYQVVGLYTTHVGKEVPFQATPLAVVEMQAKLLGLPLLLIPLPDIFPSNEVYQSTIVNALKSSGWNIDAVAFGDMFCNGIADYRRSYIEPAGWQCVFPLMGTSSVTLAHEIIERGIKTYLVTIDTEQMPSHFCGQPFTTQLLDQLPIGVDPCGEDGEFHTLVIDGPSFVHGRLQLEMISVEMGERFCHQRYHVTALPKYA